MATKTLSENVNQAISDFSSIKQAIVDKGVEVPTGTPTSQYGAKIGEIQTGGGTTPAKGFVPTAWDANGYITEGDFYGDTVPDNYFCTRPGPDHSQFNKYLKKVNFKGNVSTIKTYGFYYCSELINSELPESLTYIGDNAFFGCTNVTFSVIPSNITSIGNNAFNNCTGITSMTFKGKPTSISSTAFKGCTNLTTMNVPWSQGEVSGIPFGASNATINYNYVEE